MIGLDLHRFDVGFLSCGFDGVRSSMPDALDRRGRGLAELYEESSGDHAGPPSSTAAVDQDAVPAPQLGPNLVADHRPLPLEGFFRHIHIADRRMKPGHPGFAHPRREIADLQKIELVILDQGENRGGGPTPNDPDISRQISVPRRAEDAASLLAGTQRQPNGASGARHLVDLKRVGLAGSDHRAPRHFDFAYLPHLLFRVKITTNDQLSLQPPPPVSRDRCRSAPERRQRSRSAPHRSQRGAEGPGLARWVLESWPARG